MARPPKSTDELKASGTYRKHRHDGRIEGMADKLDAIPAHPAHFDKEHVAKWDEVCNNLLRFGILALQDLDAIQLYVETIIMQRKALKDINARGFEIKGRKNPSFNVYSDCEKIIKPLREQFGFTPRSRQSIKVKKEDTKKQDPILALLKPNKKAV